SRCGIDLDQPAFRAEAVVAAIADATTISADGFAGYADGWFAHGFVRWSSGRREGIEDALARESGGTLGFAEPGGDWIEPGDTLTAYAGCDKLFGTCRAKFGNGVTFQGFPHIPGIDFVMRYPNASDRLD